MLDTLLIAVFLVNLIDGFQPLVRLRIVIDIRNVILAQLNKKLGKDDPLDGLICFLQQGRVITKFNGGAIPVGVQIQTMVAGLVVA